MKKKHKSIHVQHRNRARAKMCWGWDVQIILTICALYTIESRSQSGNWPQDGELRTNTVLSCRKKLENALQPFSGQLNCASLNFWKCMSDCWVQILSTIECCLGEECVSRPPCHAVYILASWDQDDVFSEGHTTSFWNTDMFCCGISTAVVSFSLNVSSVWFKEMPPHVLVTQILFVFQKISPQKSTLLVVFFVGRVIRIHLKWA